MHRRSILADSLIYLALLLSVPGTLTYPVGSDDQSYSNAQSDGSNSDEQRLLVLSNEARASGRYCGDTYYSAANSLVWNAALSQGSNAYVLEMSNARIFRHDPNLDGSCMSLGEIIAHGYQTAESAVAGWLQSPNHCANLMNPSFDSFGGGSVGTYWVVRLGSDC